ncbi:hypothetical protein P7C70_g7199, partial [Phenoliferia sp. Uapishka_3]
MKLNRNRQASKGIQEAIAAEKLGETGRVEPRYKGTASKATTGSKTAIKVPTPKSGGAKGASSSASKKTVDAQKAKQAKSSTQLVEVSDDESDKENCPAKKSANPKHTKSGDGNQSEDEEEDVEVEGDMGMGQESDEDDEEQDDLFNEEDAEEDDNTEKPVKKVKKKQFAKAERDASAKRAKRRGAELGAAQMGILADEVSTTSVCTCTYARGPVGSAAKSSPWSEETSLSGTLGVRAA